MSKNDLVTCFEENLDFSQIDRQILSGFINFLINQSSNEDKKPYGLLIRCDESKLQDFFIESLTKVISKLPVDNNYSLQVVDEAGFSIARLQDNCSDAIVVLKKCSKIGNVTYLVSEFEKYPNVKKIVIASSEVIESRFKSDEHFFYRLLPRHVTLHALQPAGASENILRRLEEAGYRYTDDFKQEISFYIDSIYTTADLKNTDFADDLLRRIELQMEENDGIAAYKDSLLIDASFVPYSLIVNKRKEAESSEPKDEVTTTEKQAEEPKKVNEAETHVQTHKYCTPEKRNPKHTNVLLLSLSTIPPNIRKSEFTHESGRRSGTVIGRYQMDPVPKFLDKLLARKDENLDKIIMLCTKETLTEVEITTPEGETYKTTAEEYFKKQVINYMNPDIPENERFVSIGVSLDNPYAGIEGILKEIRKIDNPKLYLDAHGGIRGIQRVLEATVSLLYTEGIEIKKAYSVEFSNGGAKRIIDETDNVKIFNFTSGINEFVSCGRADTLVKYMKSLQLEENDLTKAIQTVAEGIQWCSIPKFQEGLKQLQSAYRTNASNLHDKADPKMSYLALYKNNIKHDYGKLTGAHTAIDEINWCIKKGFYQQALTLIESKISEVLIKDWKYLAVNEESYPVRDDGYFIQEANGITSLNELFNALVYQIKMQQVYNGGGNTKLILSSDKVNVMTDNDYSDFISYLDRKCSLKNRDKNSEKDVIEAGIETGTLLGNAITGGNRQQTKVTIKNYLKLSSSITDVQIKTLFKILIIHATLKDIRNTVNHASQESIYRPEKIKLALKYYMQWLEELNPNKDK